MMEAGAGSAGFAGSVSNPHSSFAIQYIIVTYVLSLGERRKVTPQTQQTPRVRDHSSRDWPNPLLKAVGHSLGHQEPTGDEVLIVSLFR